MTTLPRRLAALLACVALALVATACATDQQSEPPPTTSSQTVPALFGGGPTTPTPTTSAAILAGWQTYRNDQYGYRIDVPIAYTPEADQTGGAIFRGDGVTSVPTAYGTVDGDGQIAIGARPLKTCLGSSAGYPVAVGTGIRGYESGSWIATATPGTAPGQVGAPSGINILFDASGLEFTITFVGGDGPTPAAAMVRHTLATFVPGPAIANAKTC